MQLVIPPGLSSYWTPQSVWEFAVSLMVTHTISTSPQGCIFMSLLTLLTLFPIYFYQDYNLMDGVEGAIRDLVQRLHPICRWMIPKEHSSGHFQALPYPYPSLLIRISTRQLTPPGSPQQKVTTTLADPVKFHDPGLKTKKQKFLVLNLVFRGRLALLV